MLRRDILALFLQASRTFPEFNPIQDDAALPRVLLIGDSISIGYTLPVRDLLNGKYNVHRVPDNAGPTSYGVQHLDRWLGMSKWHVIHFNFGLHDIKRVAGGTHQVGKEQYEAHLEAIAGRLRKTGARLIWASTTPVPPGKLSPPRVPGDEIAYNGIAAAVMNKYGIEINDLWSFAKPRIKEIQRPANVHFTDEGSKALGEQVARAITARRR